MILWCVHVLFSNVSFSYDCFNACSTHFQDMEVCQKSAQIGLKENEKRTIEVLEANNSERYSCITKKEQEGHFRRIRMI